MLDQQTKKDLEFIRNLSKDGLWCWMDNRPIGKKRLVPKVTYFIKRLLNRQSIKSLEKILKKGNEDDRSWRKSVNTELAKLRNKYE